MTPVMRRRFFSGDTLERALMQAAREYQVEPSQISYKVLEKRHGFLKIRRGVVIEVDPEAPERTADASPVEMEAAEDPARNDTLEAPPEVSPEAEEEQEIETVVAEPSPDLEAESRPEPESELEPELEPVLEREGAAQEQAASEPERGEVVALPTVPTAAGDLYPEATGELADAARKGLERLLDALELDLDAVILQGEDRLEIELQGNGEQELLDRDGELLLAIQHLLPRIMRGISGQSTACRVDSNHFHEMREERLRTLAQDAAAQAVHQGKRQTLSPMSPEERRIIHITLVDDGEVDTESQGQGFFKRVIVRPARARSREF